MIFRAPSFFYIIQQNYRNCLTFAITIFIPIKLWAHHHNVVDFRSGWALCSCRFAFATDKTFVVAAASLALRFRTEQSFLGGASDEPLGATRCWSRRRYHRT